MGRPVQRNRPQPLTRAISATPRAAPAGMRMVRAEPMVIMRRFCQRRFHVETWRSRRGHICSATAKVVTKNIKISRRIMLVRSIATPRRSFFA